MSGSCRVSEHVENGQAYGPSTPAPPHQSRRDFVRRMSATIGGLTCADFLGYFAAHGMPAESKSDANG